MAPRGKKNPKQTEKNPNFASSQLVGIDLVVLTQQAHQIKHKDRDNFLFRQILQHQFS